GYSEDVAHRLMLQGHHEGRSVVSSGSREKMEVDVQAMHSYGLWATLSQEGESGMRAFRRRRGYYDAELEGDEATILSRVVADTAMLLGERLDTGATTDTSTDTSANTGPDTTGPDTTGPDRTGPDTDRNLETTGTAATGPDADQSPEPGTPQDPLQAMSWPAEGVSAPTDPALARLLPDASE